VRIACLRRRETGAGLDVSTTEGSIRASMGSCQVVFCVWSGGMEAAECSPARCRDESPAATTAAPRRRDGVEAPTGQRKNTYPRQGGPRLQRYGTLSYGRGLIKRPARPAVRGGSTRGVRAPKDCRLGPPCPAKLGECGEGSGWECQCPKAKPRPWKAACAGEKAASRRGGAHRRESPRGKTCKFGERHERKTGPPRRVTSRILGHLSAETFKFSREFSPFPPIFPAIFPSFPLISPLFPSLSPSFTLLSVAQPSLLSPATRINSDVQPHSPGRAPRGATPDRQAGPAGCRWSSPSVSLRPLGLSAICRVSLELPVGFAQAPGTECDP